MRLIKFSGILVILFGILFLVTNGIIPEYSSFPAVFFWFALCLFVIGVADHLTFPEMDLLSQIIKERNLPYALYFASLCLLLAAAILRS